MVAAPASVIARGRIAPLVVEWLSVVPLGLQTLARREMELAPEVRLNAQRSPDRLIRFRRSGASPLTVSATELGSNWTLPATVGGSELIVHVERAPVRPERVALQGPTTRTIRVGPTVTVLSGVPPGGYTATPLYEGSIRGRAARFSIESGDSREVFIPREPVGGAVLRGDPRECHTAVELSLERVGANGQRVPLTPLRPDPDCAWRLLGLPPSSYQAILKNHLGVGGVAVFRVLTQAVADVALERPTVIATGHVSYNGVALPSLSLNVSGGNIGVAGVNVPVAPDGSYLISLAPPALTALPFSIA